MNATIRLSDNALRTHAIDTGELLDAEITLEVPLKAMTTEQRTEFLAITGVESSVNLASYRGEYTFGAVFEHDSVPITPVDWLNLVRRYEIARIAHTEQERLDDQRYQTKRSQRLEQVRVELEGAFERAQELDDDEFRWGWTGVKRELATIIQKLETPDERDRASQRVASFDEYLRKLQRSDEHRRQAEYDAQIKAIAQRETERKEQLTKALKDIEGWIVQNGSVVLVQSWQIGDDVRARHEHPPFKLDEYRMSRWVAIKDASREALKLAHASQGEAVWLLQPPRKLKLGDSWKPREGVVIQNYLGMYTLVAELGANGDEAIVP